MPSLTEIAEGILADAKRIDAYTASKGLPDASFEKDTLSELPTDLEDCRKSLVDSAHELKQLAQGPVGILLELLFTVSSPIRNILRRITEGMASSRTSYRWNLSTITTSHNMYHSPAIFRSSK